MRIRVKMIVIVVFFCATIIINGQAKINLAIAMEKNGLAQVSGGEVRKYRLKSPLPTIANIGTVSEGVSTSGNRTMWRGPGNQVHLLATFGGGTKRYWWGHYVNLTIGVSALMAGPRGSAGWWAYHPSQDRMYIGGSYAGSLAEFNPVTKTIKTLSDTLSVCLNLIIGDDNLVYYAGLGNRLYSYSPIMGYPAGWKDYGVVHAGADPGSNYFSIAAGKGHVYCGVKCPDGHWTLVISSTISSPIFTEWKFGNAGDTSISFSKELNSSRWLCFRTLSDGSTKIYHLHDGNYTEIKGKPTGEYHQERAPHYCATADNEAMYHILPDTYGWESDFADLFPIKGIHEYSRIRYRKVKAQAWNESRMNFTSGWKPQAVQCVLPRTGDNLFIVSAGYAAELNFNYVNKAKNYLGASFFSPYTVMEHPSGEIYLGGYPNSVLRYDPTRPWTLNSSKTTPRLPSDGEKTNPFFIEMIPGNQIHYRHGLDFDCNGIVWIGGNTTRKTPDYGSVMWYEPSDGTFGYMFSGWESAGIKFSNLCAAISRTRICVSDNSGNIWIINASTKTVDPTPIVPVVGGSKTYMIEVANDLVFGIVISASGNKVMRFKPSTKEVLTLKNFSVTGTPFGFGDNQYDRMNYKLEMGPDGYVWMFVGDSLYRVDPNTCLFTKIMDTPHAKLKFAPNNLDLLLYSINGTTNFKYIPGILEVVSP